MNVLAEPLELRNGVILANRIAKVATSEGLADKGGEPTPGLITLYRRWADGGAGLLITGNVIVHPDGRESQGNVVVEDERHLDMLVQWAQSGRSVGAEMWMQINHAGAQARTRLVKERVAPSCIPATHMNARANRVRELSSGEIEDLVQRFASTAAIAKRAGFTGVQIHAAHGYLVSEFLSPYTNRRCDQWGGDAKRRRRFLVEIIRTVRCMVGFDFSISAKVNSADFRSGGLDGRESMEVIREIEREGVDLVEISGGTKESPTMLGRFPARYRQVGKHEAYFFNYAKNVRKVTRVPLLLTGGMRTGRAMESVIQNRAADVIGLARPLIVEPALPARLLENSESKAMPLDWPLRRVPLRRKLEGSWWHEQMRLIAEGGDPDPTLGLWDTLIAIVKKKWNH